jgi:hypothetical protein
MTIFRRILFIAVSLLCGWHPDDAQAIALVKVTRGSGKLLGARQARFEAEFCFLMLAVFCRLWPNIETRQRAILKLSQPGRTASAAGYQKSGICD